MKRNALSLKYSLGAGLLALTLAAASAKADEIVYVSPTSSIVSVSDSYVYPTSSIVSTRLVPTSTTYLSPTSYLVPTSTVYSTSSYIVPTSTVYVPRSYARRAFRSAYLSPTYYVAPTTYLSPTVYLSPTTYLAPTRYLGATSYLSATSYAAPICCDTAPVASSGTTAAPAAKPATTANADDERVERRPTGEVEGAAASNDQGVRNESRQRPQITSEPASGAANPTGGAATPPASQQNPQRVTTPPPSTPVTPPAGGPGAGAATRSTVPAPTSPAPKAATPPLGAGSPPLPNDPDPIAPLPETNLDNIPPPFGSPGAGATKRDSFRPIMRDADTAGARAARNVLKGRVLSANTGEVEEGVTVTLSDRLQRFADRTAKTDAFGRFAVSLPEGDWTVKVTMPSGNSYIVGNNDLTASAGKILDDTGQEVGLLTIRR